ncbi:MAG: DNA/RNA non-specific endonuclease [Oscillospiraceae bacterium]|nr:DNA/RNA non-specific endonuclease [Oscillospiraceae bacterium]
MKVGIFIWRNEENPSKRYYHFEDKTAEYIRRSGNHVLYRVTPVFDGSNLVASGVLMEALSVEDNGSGLSFCVFCYNVQPGIGINYSDGESWITEEPVQTEPEEIKQETVSETENTGQQYILNTNTKEFHYPSCRSVSQMKEENKKEYTGTRDEVINQGYSACKNCNP